MTEKTLTDAHFSQEPWHFGLVVSRYNPTYTDGLLESALAEIGRLSPRATYEVHRVPGAFEIPYVASALGHKGHCDAILALGLILRGATAHANLIAQSITQSLQDIALHTETPVVHEVLLVEDEEQARQRCLEEKLNRGQEAARVAIHMAQIKQSLSA